MTDRNPDDATVLRTDSSVSRSFSGNPKTAPGTADAPRVLKSRFVLEEKLGSGGMGTVFRAKDLRKVEARDRQPFLAIKVLNNDFREHPEAFIALQREAAKSQALAHPNIVTIYDFDKDGDVPFMTMELLEGQELAELLRAYPNGLPETTAWPVIGGICAGLKHAHGAGIVHADFKPGNVFVSPTNAPKILDFGIARAVQLTDVQGEDTLFDPARLAALTPAYASREMLAGDNPEPRDDLYSLGIVIYLILTGHHPYGRMSAEDAAREGLKPERPRGLSRRQWQVLQRCLAFNRQDRPQDIAEVEKYLLGPSPWPARGLLAVAATLLVALTANYLIGEEELSEVKQEVRQTTLLDAQRARLTALLDAATFDANWEQSVASEYRTLAELDTAGAVRDELSEKIRDTYGVYILSLDDLDLAIDLLHRGAAYGDLTATTQVVEQRAFERIWRLLETPRPDMDWLEALRGESERLRAAFPHSRMLAELDLAVAETLEILVREALDAGRLETAARLLAELEPRLFDDQTREALLAAVAAARQRAERARQAELLAAERRAQEAALDEALGASCLRLDIARIQTLAAADALDGENVLDRLASRFSECVAQLAELDPDRAARLERDVVARFGSDLLASAVAVDPCSLSYLVGNGAQAGRQGYCADRVSGDDQGPKLVVLPKADGSGRFAMTKQEISWSQFKRFCVELEGCAPAEIERLQTDDRLPVTGVSLRTAQAFARWLSETTGYIYRLPTHNEWLWAARGEPDPNRNCRVQIDGVERGRSPVPAATGAGNDFGLLNMLGNVQEWVLEEDGIYAVGGSYSDPIGACIAATERPHDGAPAADTGFRLVREIS
ncbi:MAG: bifunctional serine/threonine-protein kinase/formylglycine-generating enzyme family protein [Pseudomonadales bacterium]